MDPTTRQPCVYRSNALFHGTSVKHWALFTFEDGSRDPGTLNVGVILGFVRVMNRDNNSEQLHVVARCFPNYHDFNKKILTDIKLLAGDDSIYFIPIQDMIGPLCVVPNVHKTFRMAQDHESRMAVIASSVSAYAYLEPPKKDASHFIFSRSLFGRWSWHFASLVRVKKWWLVFICRKYM